WPPSHGSGSWSSRITRRPASASSAVATSPARPPPTTITAASSLTGSLQLSCHHLAVPPGMHVDIVCADLRLQELLAVYAERDAVRAPCDDALAHGSERTKTWVPRAQGLTNLEPDRDPIAKRRPDTGKGGRSHA